MEKYVLSIFIFKFQYAYGRPITVNVYKMNDIQFYTITIIDIRVQQQFTG